MHAFDRDSIEIDVLDAADIDGPCVRIGSRTPERLNATDRTEVISRCARMEHIHTQLFQRREQPEVVRRNAKIKSAATSANGAIADTDMVDIGIDLEPDLAAMARASIGLLHRFKPYHIDRTKASPEAANV